MQTNARTTRPRVLGAQAHTVRDNLYSIGDGVLLYTFPTFCTEQPVRRCAANLVLTLGDEPLQLTVEGATRYCRAAVIKPRTARACRAQQGVNLQIDPSHPRFPHFRTIDSSGVQRLNRDAFRKFDIPLHLAYRGELSIDDAAILAEQLLDTALACLPAVKPLDPRVLEVMALLKANPRYPLRHLAGAVGLSYYRLSHLFLDEMGISLRSFHLWRKVHTATRLLGQMSIVEAARMAGFTDGSHLSHAFRQLHAVSPSYFFDDDYVNIIARPPDRRLLDSRKAPK